jgi:hypothetical protein
LASDAIVIVGRTYVMALCHINAGTKATDCNEGGFIAPFAAGQMNLRRNPDSPVSRRVAAAEYGVVCVSEAQSDLNHTEKS